MRFSVVVLAALAALSGGAQAAGNLVIDGSFSAGLANWQALYVDRSDSAFVYTYSGPTNLSKIEKPSETALGYIPSPGGRALIFADGHVKWEPSPTK